MSSVQAVRPESDPSVEPAHLVPDPPIDGAATGAGAGGVRPILPQRRSTRSWDGAPIFGLLFAGLTALLVVTGVGERVVELARPAARAAVAPPAAAQSPAPSSSPRGPAERVPFAFRVRQVVAVPVGSGRPPDVAGRAAGLVAQTLSGLYDGAFLDPAAWGRSVPDGVWQAFAPGIRARARRDAPSFTLSALPGSVRTMKVSSSSLSIEVLLGPNGSAEAALAEVTFQARGQLETGEGLLVSTHATLLLRPSDGRWLIEAYPEAATEIEPLAATSPKPPPPPTSSPGGIG